MAKPRPKPPRPDRIRSIQGSFSWIDHRFLRQGFDQGLTRLEKLLYFVLVAVSNHEGVSFYSDRRLGEFLDIRYPHELVGARRELVARDLIAYEEGIYQVLQLPARSLTPETASSQCLSRKDSPSSDSFPSPPKRGRPPDLPSGWKSLRQVLDLEDLEED
jgi:hypothetical protein